VATVSVHPVFTPVHRLSQGLFPGEPVFGGFSLLINRPFIAQAFRPVCQQRSINANKGQYRPELST
ncbi:hypothetical protein, partial [Serratia marcescens]|uniref:hypothetical protein n=1 Tax=Serratia marcescens TaxID=615 RepID=UPI003204E598